MVTLAAADATGLRQATAGDLVRFRRNQIVAPGVIEPAGEEYEISSQLIGIIREMRVQENDSVTSGQIIAVIDNDGQLAREAAARAQLQLRRAELQRAMNGARPEERREAIAALEEARANLVVARKDFERRTPLAKSAASSQAVLDQSMANLNGAEARKKVLSERLAIIEAGTRSEEIDAARARVDLAEAELKQAGAEVAKTYLCSPISGVVLRRLRIAGEAVTNIPPTPIAIVGDLSKLRVRTEVDQTDIGQVNVGQRVEVSGDVFGGRSLGGTVFRVSFRMGAKEIRTGCPAERVDTKVLQVLVDLDAGVTLPIGLRVDVRFAM